MFSALLNGPNHNYPKEVGSCAKTMTTASISAMPENRTT